MSDEAGTLNTLNIPCTAESSLSLGLFKVFRVFRVAKEEKKYAT